MSDQTTLNEQIGQWRSWQEKRPVMVETDLDELEDHLRTQIDDLVGVGLSSDEAFLIAVRRLGNMDEVSAEYAREHSDRLWKQLAVEPSTSTTPGRSHEVWVALAFAVVAGALVKLPQLFGVDLGKQVGFYLHNIPILVLSVLTAFFIWRRGLRGRAVLAIGAAFVATAVFANVYPWPDNSATEALSAMHVPVLLWLVAGVAYVAGRWRDESSRMHFIRFTGEWAIYFALIALGGGALMALTFASFSAIGIDPSTVVSEWVMPCGAAGAVIVAAHLVESKQSVIENMAPVLTKVFTPLATLMLTALLVASLVTGASRAGTNRDLLIISDVVLVLVTALLLYAWSARESTAKPGLFDWLQLVLVSAALFVDVIGLIAMLTRISSFGASPNKVAALGLNLLLLVNLVWTAWLLLNFLRGRRPFHALVRWQTRFVPIYAVWAAVVVVIFPLAFRFA